MGWSEARAVVVVVVVVVENGIDGTGAIPVICKSGGRIRFNANAKRDKFPFIGIGSKYEVSYADTGWGFRFPGME